MQWVVVTGLGAVTPLAAGVEASWSRHLPGRSGIQTLPNEVGLESSYTILELRDRVAPPTLNLSAPDPAYDGMDLVTNQTTKQMDHEISNGFGFGGINASELFRRWTGKPADASESLASYSFPQSMKEMTERTMCPHRPCRAVAPPPVAGRVGHPTTASGAHPAPD